MEESRQPFLKKRPNKQFTNGGNKRGKFNSSSSDQSSGSSQTSDTVYRILCQSKRIGSVIGKGGGIVKALREETQSKITVADSVPGSEERVIIIYSPSTKLPMKQATDNGDENLSAEKEDDHMKLHCAAQDALLRVHNRIVEEDILGGYEANNDNATVVTARLLVSNYTVGCLLGKKGDVIQRLRSETGASIRVLPAEQLPVCAESTDELVQISGKPAAAKRALYEVSTLLHQNPRKDKPPSSLPATYETQVLRPHAPPLANMLSPGSPMWSERNSNTCGMPPVPWMEYGSEPSRFRPRGFDGDPALHNGEAPSEFSMKILCSTAKIGGVIGKGGSNVKQLQQETGTTIHVDDVSAETDERVIRVSAFEALWNPRSRTIDAILLLQDKTSEHSEKGIITTRLLIPSSKVGCILGQGGHVINEMRRRTQADIRVYSKEEKPKCAGVDEELVQVSGNYGVAKDALAEIASRYRARCLRDAKPGAEPVPMGPGPGFGPRGSLPGSGGGGGGRLPPSSNMRGGHSGGYDHFEGGSREYEPHSYPVPPRGSGYPSAMEIKMPSSGRGSLMGHGLGSAGDVSGTRMKLQDHPYAAGSEHMIEFRDSSQHLDAGHNVYQSYGIQHNNPPPTSYQNNDYGAHPQSAYPPVTNSSQTSYHNPSNPQQPPPYQYYQNNPPSQHGHYHPSTHSSSHQY